MLRKYKKHIVKPDHVYSDSMFSKFINYIMQDGKKAKARKIFYESLDILKQTHKDFIKSFKEAVKNVSPSVIVKSRRIGGSNYQIPITISEVHSLRMGMKAIIKAATKRNEKRFPVKLSMEIKDALNKKGEAYKFKQDFHKQAQANKTFSHIK